MPNKPTKPAKLRPDVAETAFRVMQEATGQAPKTDPATKAKNPDAVARGSKGGKKGGKKGGDARAAKLTPEEREAAAQVAAMARWKKS